jgi:translation elongation factor EF-1beta
VTNEGIVKLADAVDELRSQLAEAQEAAYGEDISFGLENIEVEFTLELRKEGGVEGKLQFGVVTIGGSGSLSSAQTHKVKFVLHPMNSVGQDIKIKGKLTEPPPE